MPPSGTNDREEENREFSFSFPPQRRNEEEKRETYNSPDAKEIPSTERPEEQKLAVPEAWTEEPPSIPQGTPSQGAVEEQRSEGLAKKIESRPTKETEDYWTISLPAPRDDKRFIISDESQPIQTKSAPDGQPQTKQSRPLQEDKTTDPVFEPQNAQPLSTLPYLSLFGCLLLALSLLTFAHQVQPRRIDKFIKGIPWFGPTVFRNNHLRHNVALQSLRPSIQRLMGNREVLVVSGVATNHNPTGVRQVRIEGRAYSNEGKEIERQTIAVGNAISEKIIRDISPQDLSILQKLNPQKRFEIPSEESANFTIVFLKPIKEIKTFSCRVVSAEEPA